MLSKKKKIFILSGMVVLLVATGFLNVWLNNRDKTVNANATEAGNFFTTYRAERENTRNQTILYLDAVIANADLSDSDKADAIAQRAALTRAIEVERVLEGDILALGYADCVVAASTGYVNVYLSIDRMLTADELAQVLYMAMSETGRPATAVRVIPTGSAAVL
ncbi:MAG: SpoIIIAH-like family protein [Clostridiales bacterium]|jgi:hypothetical protein|nr:SpoIIIAH-like family protein [Clostridiales bacterium]